MSEKKIHSYVAELKAVGDGASGEFEGYASVFGVVDSYDEVVLPGAFAESISNKMPIMLWQHAWQCPIGVYTEAREDAKGLFVKGQLNLDVQQGREAYSLLKQGALKGMSIGFRTLEDSTDRTTGLRYLKKIDLMEVSLVTFPANEAANVERVKSAPADIRSFEKFLRDGGFSQNEAKLIASKGYRALEIHREGGDFALAVDALKGAESQLRKLLSHGGNGTADQAR